jgi:hypothetical protein
MSRHERKTELVGPWRSLHLAVWLIGLAILAWRDWWWPGLLVLAGISLLIEAALRQYAPQAYQEVEEAAAPAPAAPTSPPPPPVVEHRLELLPSICPSCGGPIRGVEVRWTGPQSADCPYCGTNLPMAAGVKHSE